MNLHVKFEHAVCTVPISSHKGTLPSELKYLTQIAYVTSSDLNTTEIEEYRRIMGLEQEDWNPATSHMTNPDGLPEKAVNIAASLRQLRWRPLRASSNPFLTTINQDVDLFEDTYFDPEYASSLDCDHEYSVDPSGCITTTLPEGLLLVAYLRLPQDSSGDLLIPDDEDVKDALMHFVMYRYYMRKYIISREIQDRQAREDHLDMFQVLKIKVAGKFIDIDTMENIKAHRDHLVPRSERYNGFFAQLNRRETENPNMSSYRYYW